MKSRQSSWEDASSGVYETSLKVRCIEITEEGRVPQCMTPLSWCHQSGWEAVSMATWVAEDERKRSRSWSARLHSSSFLQRGFGAAPVSRVEITRECRGNGVHDPSVKMTQMGCEATTNAILNSGGAHGSTKRRCTRIALVEVQGIDASPRTKCRQRVHSGTSRGDLVWCPSGVAIISGSNRTSLWYAF